MKLDNFKRVLKLGKADWILELELWKDWDNEYAETYPHCVPEESPTVAWAKAHIGWKEPPDITIAEAQKLTDDYPNLAWFILDKLDLK